MNAKTVFRGAGKKMVSPNGVDKGVLGENWRGLCCDFG